MVELSDLFNARLVVFPFFSPKCAVESKGKLKYSIYIILYRTKIKYIEGEKCVDFDLGGD